MALFTMTCSKDSPTEGDCLCMSSLSRLSSRDGLHGLALLGGDDRRLRMFQPVAIDRSAAYDPSSLYASVAAAPPGQPAHVRVRRRLSGRRLQLRVLCPPRV